MITDPEDVSKSNSSSIWMAEIEAEGPAHLN